MLTTVFAATTGAGPHGGYGVANATVAADLRRGRAAVAADGQHGRLHGRLSGRACGG